MKMLSLWIAVKRMLIPAVLLTVPVCMQAHPSFSAHRADFYAVLPLEPCEEADAWMKCISSGMIDDYRGVERPEFGGLNFYDYLKQKYPPFKCKHRALFHWGYNANPWTDYLQRKVEGYGWSAERISLFREELVCEQQRRNRTANGMTEKFFGYASGGKDAGYANAMISIVYDVHLIGDYTSDNTDMDGLQLFTSAVGDLINALRRLDEVRCRQMVKDIQTAVNTDEDVQVRADRLMSLLYRECPGFIMKAQGGSLVRRWRKNGIKTTVG